MLWTLPHVGSAMINGLFYWQICKTFTGMGQCACTAGLSSSSFVSQAIPSLWGSFEDISIICLMTSNVPPLIWCMFLNTTLDLIKEDRLPLNILVVSVQFLKKVLWNLRLKIWVLVTIIVFILNTCTCMSKWLVFLIRLSNSCNCIQHDNFHLIRRSRRRPTAILPTAFD